MATSQHRASPSIDVPESDVPSGAMIDNPYRQDTFVRPVDAEPSSVEILDTEVCWALAGTSDIGRIAIVDEEGRPEVLPVNFLVHDRHLYIRSAPGTKLMNITSRPLVTFEIDGHDDLTWWSVILHGSARRLAIDAEIDESGVLGLASWNPTEKHNFVRIAPSRVTGRRFPRTRPESADLAPADLAPAAAEQATPEPNLTHRLRLAAAWVLVVTTVFSALSALAGGVGMLLTGGLGMPTSLLTGGPFTSFVWPGLVLLLIVGGTQTIASILLLKRRESALLWTAVAGFGMVIWILVETVVINGFSWLQGVYVVTGMLQLVLVIGLLGAAAWLPRRSVAETLGSATARVRA